MQVSMQIALLERRSISELQETWKQYFDAPPTTYNKEFYISRIAHRIQELAYGGLSANQQKLIANMYVQQGDKNNLPPAGTRIVRELPNEVVLSEEPDITIETGTDVERTHFAFGTQDKWGTLARVTGIKPRSSKVEITAAVEDARVHAN